MGMELEADHISRGGASVSPLEDQFTDVEIEVHDIKKSQPHGSSNNELGADGKEGRGEEVEKEARIGGILHPNENLPRPEPPAEINLDASEPAAPATGDGFSAIGRFIRQQSTALARQLSMKEAEENSGDVVTEVKLSGVKVIVEEKKASGGNALKGRVTFFSRSNCRDCGAVRSFLREKRLYFVEINLDVFPMREKELAERTGGLSVPKIFFNGSLIGGLAELNEMRRSGDMPGRLKALLGAKCPDGDASVPAAPVYGFDDAVEDPTDEMIGIVQILKQRLAIQDRLIRMRIVSNTFTASELIELLQRHLGCRRSQAVEMGKDLVRKHFIHPVFGEHKFEDGNNVYRFLEHEPYIPKCYNFRGSTDEREPKPASEIGQRLCKIMSAILESYASEDRQFVDYMSISNSEEFRRYLNLVQGLQRTDISSLNPSEKLAFFMNLYNAMVIHAVIRLGHPQGMMDRKSMVNDFQYLVGGHPYSLSAVRNGILRGNRRPPYSLGRPFTSGDTRLEIVLSSVSPLIHFGLCDGTRSGPSVRFFTPENVAAELRVATRDFFSRGGIQVDLTKRTVYLSSIIKWYGADFGNDREILKWVINYLDPSHAGLVTHLLGDWAAVNIKYLGYDWSLNS